MHQHKLRLSIYGLFAIVALVILVDFIAPGRILNDEIIDVQSEIQRYNNAAGNSHNSYKAITREYEFSIKEDFAELELINQQIEFSVSRIFKEVNWYRLLSAENKSFYSLRIVSGLVLPLLTIISMLIAIRFKKNLGILVFVLQALLIADLIFLML